MEIATIVLILIAVFITAKPAGRYISHVFKGEPVSTDFMRPLEEWIFRISRVDAHHEVSWSRNAAALLKLNFLFFLWGFVLLLIQGYIPFLNPDGKTAMEPSLAFHTAISFVTNTNQQHYAGEADLSHFSQIMVVVFLQFVSAATGIAAYALFLVGLKKRGSHETGNFYWFFVRSITRILLPLSLVISIFLVVLGTPNNYTGAKSFITLEGDSASVALGPVATVTSIKQVGTNGGGYYGTNSAHPFENPNFITNAVENFAILFLPVALVCTFGYFLDQRRLTRSFLLIMSAIFLSFTVVTVLTESGGPLNLEGKEVRFGPALSAFWGVSTTATSNGSVNSMLDSQQPLSQAVYLADMMVNAVYGGVGVGMINFMLYVILSAFIAGLMVGRTPELLGKKIEGKEIKIAVLTVLIHPILILGGTAIASRFAPGVGQGIPFHEFTRMLYEFTSAAANNGSGLEGLADNNGFWNISTGIVMFLGRFIPIVGPLAITGSFASKNIVPASEGTLDTSGFAFGLVIIGVMVIVSALSFFPALAIGPLALFIGH